MLLLAILACIVALGSVTERRKGAWRRVFTAIARRTLQDQGAARRIEQAAEVVRVGALSAKERAQWQTLLRAAPESQSPFLSPAFSECVARVRPGVRVCVLTRGGEPAGFLPFQFASRWHGLLGAAERVGGHMSDVLGVIARPGLRVDPAEVLSACGLQAFEVSHLPAQQQTFGLTGERPEPALTIDIGAGWEDFWAKRRGANPEFVRNTQQKLRKIETALGPLSFEMRRIGAPARNRTGDRCQARAVSPHPGQEDRRSRKNGPAICCRNST